MDTSNTSNFSSGETVKIDRVMACIRCDKQMPLDFDSPHNPRDGLSLEATGNWPSAVWDDNRSAWFVLCDECAKARIEDALYCMEAVKTRPQTVWKPVVLQNADIPCAQDSDA